MNSRVLLSVLIQKKAGVAMPKPTFTPDMGRHALMGAGLGAAGGLLAYLLSNDKEKSLTSHLLGGAALGGAGGLGYDAYKAHQAPAPIDAGIMGPTGKPNAAAQGAAQLKKDTAPYIPRAVGGRALRRPLLPGPKVPNSPVRQPGMPEPEPVIPPTPGVNWQGVTDSVKKFMNPPGFP